MKKLISLIAVCAMVGSAVGCSTSEKPENSTDTSNTEALGAVRQTMYKESLVYLDTHIADAISIHAVGDECHIFYNSLGNELRRLVLDADRNVSSDDYIARCIGTLPQFCVNDDGTFYAVMPTTDFPLEYGDNGYITNSEDFYKDGELGFSLVHYAGDCSVISETEIIGLDKEFNKRSSRPTCLCHYGDDLIYSFYNGIAKISTDGELLDCEHYDYQAVHLGNDIDGNIIAAEPHNFGSLDGDSLKLPESILGEYEERLDIEGCPIAGYGEFKAFIRRGDGIYGIRQDDTIELVVDYTKSLITKTDIGKFVCTGDGEFVTVADSSKQIRIYNRRPDDYSEERTEINVWQVNLGDAGTSGVEFSRTNDKYSVNLRTNPTVRADELHRALLVGEGPDAIYYDGGNEMQHLMNLGALADLNPLIDGSDSLKRERLMPNVLEAFDMDGKLYALPEYFDMPMFMTNKLLVGEEYRNWSFDDLYRLYEEAPEGTKFYDGSPQHLFYTLAQQNVEPWIDEKNATCNFDSEDFIKLLKFCKETSKDSNAFFREPADHDEADEFAVEMEKLEGFRDGQVMFDWTSNTGGLELMIENAGSYGLDFDRVTWVNYPGNGDENRILPMYLFSVMETSENKEGAWEYIAYMLSDERQCRQAEFCAFNWTNLKAFEKGVESKIRKGTEPKMGSYHFSYDDISVTLDFPRDITREQADAYKELVLSCNKLAMGNWEIGCIMDEEYQRYFNDEISAEECAKVIQNRVEIMLSEKS